MMQPLGPPRRSIAQRALGLGVIVAFVIVAYASSGASQEDAPKEGAPKEFDQNTQVVEVTSEPTTITLNLSEMMKAALTAAVEAPIRNPGGRQIRLSVEVERLVESVAVSGSAYVNLPEDSKLALNRKNPHFLGSFFSSHPPKPGEGSVEEFYLDLVEALRKLSLNGDPVPDVLQLTFVPARQRVRDEGKPGGYRVLGVYLAEMSARAGAAEPKGKD